MADKTQQIALQLAQALANISNGSPFVMERVQIDNDILATQNKGQQDINSLIKDLQEINRLIKAKSNNKKVENAYTVSKNIVQLDYETGQETLHEHLNLLESKQKGDLISMIIQSKQKDLSEKSIVYLLNIVLNEFNILNFSSAEKSINAEFVNQLISKEEIKGAFALTAAFLTTSITKSNLIKELRKAPIKEMVKLLEVILILLQNASIVPVKDDKYIPSFEQLCEWVEALLDAYYLNFCLKEDWKDLLEKLDVEIESRNQLYEQSKSFTESINTYQKCYDNIQKSVNKVESQFYVKSIYL